MTVDPNKNRVLSPSIVGWLIAALLAPIYFIVAHLYGKNLGVALSCICVVFAGVIYGFGKAAIRWSFLTTLGILFVIHVLIVLHVTLPRKFPGYALIPVGLADLLLVIGIMTAFNRLMGIRRPRK